MTQKDISDLLDADVSWQAGTITRKRSKTANHAGVPSVTYQLWPETFRLLQQHRSQKEVVLLTKAGKRLVEERLDETGAYRKSDSVKSAYDRGMAKLPFSKPFKLLRKTSATMIHANPQFRGLDPLFLGHGRHDGQSTMSVLRLPPIEDPLRRLPLLLGCLLVGLQNLLNDRQHRGQHPGPPHLNRTDQLLQCLAIRQGPVWKWAAV